MTKRAELFPSKNLFPQAVANRSVDSLAQGCHRQVAVDTTTIDACTILEYRPDHLAEVNKVGPQSLR